MDQILPDREGNLTVRDWEDNRYVVKEWYTGRECDTSSEHEIMAAVSNLARIHRLMQLTPQEKRKVNCKADAEKSPRNADVPEAGEWYTAGKNTKSEAELKARSEAGTEAESEARLEAGSEAELKARLEAGSKIESKAKSTIRSETEARLAVESKAESETKSESEKKSNVQVIYMCTPDPLQEIRAQNAELRKIRSFIRKRNDKGQFERQFLQCFERYYAQAEAKTDWILMNTCRIWTLNFI